MEKFESLSEFIRKTREKAGFSVSGLAKRAGLKEEQIQDVEEGKDLFLPSTIRQKLAKALKINPADIKEYERIMLDSYDKVNKEYTDSIKSAIMQGETENLRCPVCGSKLVTKIVRMIDLHDNIVCHPKAHCSKCSFQVK